MPVEVVEVSGLKPEHVMKVLKRLICKTAVRLKYLDGPLYAGDGIIREVWESTL